jgi:hypothetical protein
MIFSRLLLFLCFLFFMVIVLNANPFFSLLTCQLSIKEIQDSITSANATAEDNAKRKSPNPSTVLSPPTSPPPPKTPPAILMCRRRLHLCVARGRAGAVSGPHSCGAAGSLLPRRRCPPHLQRPLPAEAVHHPVRSGEPASSFATSSLCGLCDTDIVGCKLDDRWGSEEGEEGDSAGEGDGVCTVGDSVGQRGWSVYCG